jgi:hypothetical protein
MLAPTERDLPDIDRALAEDVEPMAEFALLLA